MSLMGELDLRVEGGYLRSNVSDEGLRIYCYTEKTVWERHWDQYTRRARGLVLSPDGEIVARPFPKFFNLGEPSCPELPNLPYSLYEKLDGSLGIWFYYKGRWRVCTKGSFQNDYVTFAEKYVNYLDRFPKNLTVLCEIVPPPSEDGMVRVTKHTPDLYFLGAVDRCTGEDMDPASFQRKWPGPSSMRDDRSIEDALSKAPSLEGTEGWVVRYSNGTRVKIKTAWYLRLFRAISDLSVKRIQELLISGQGISGFPEEFRLEAEVIANSLLSLAKEKSERVHALYDASWHGDRKTFAQRVSPYKEKGLLFALYDGKDIEKKILASVY